MPLFQFKTYQTNKTLYEGRFSSAAACLEQAVIDKTDLSGIDLRRLNLSNANLDDAIMPGAWFEGSNLTGANLSEANFAGSYFTDAALYNACLCYSDLSGCNFENANFGATDIAGAVLDQCWFSTLSCFSLDFATSESMTNCIFNDLSGQLCPMSKPPVVIQGLLRQTIVLMDQDMKLGNRLMSRPKFSEILTKQVMQDNKCMQG